MRDEKITIPTLVSAVRPADKCYVQSSVEFRVLKLEYRVLTE